MAGRQRQNNYNTVQVVASDGVKAINLATSGYVYLYKAGTKAPEPTGTQ